MTDNNDTPHGYRVHTNTWTAYGPQMSVDEVLGVLDRVGDRSDAVEPVIVDVLDAAAILTAETRQNGLAVRTFEIHPGQQGVDEPRRQVPARLTEIRLHLFGTPDLFLRWAEHLQVEQVHVHRRAFDTCLHASVVLHGLRWRVNGDASRPYDSGRYLPHLPGIIVDWAKQPSGRRGDDAHITLPELRATLAALGIAGGAQ